MKLSYCILSRILPVLVTFTAVIGLISCGGGTDVGNPDVCGTVTNPGGGYAAGARVVLGTGGNDVGLVYTTYVESVEGIVICFKAVRNFDTAYCDSKGQFTFKEVPPGDYSLLASQGALLALQKINHSRDYGTMAGMQLSEPAEIAVRMVNPGSDSLKFIAARVDGTLLAAVPDSTGVFRFPPLPAGDLDIIFYRENETWEEYNGFTVASKCSSSLVVDPLRSPSLWAAEECGPRDPLAHPYVIWTSPKDNVSGALARVNYGRPYDIAIQFSHPMDTRVTSTAVHLVSSDPRSGIDSVWWQGADVLNIVLKRMAAEQVPFRAGYAYTFMIDTTAQSALAVRSVFPESLTITPEPSVRVRYVDAFGIRKTVAVDSSDSVSYSVTVSTGIPAPAAFSAGNRFTLHLTGVPVMNTLTKGITVKQDTTQVSAEMTGGSDSISIHFADTLERSVHYSVSLDTLLLFENGMKFPKAQVLEWTTGTQ